MRRPTFTRIALTLALAALPHGSTHAAVSVPLAARDTASLARSGEPVRCGVPIPRSAGLLSAASLSVLGPGGSAVPARVTVTGRWGAGPADLAAPIRFLLVELDADVAAGGTTTYTLTDQGPGPGLPAISVVETAGDVSVDTGVARFVVSKTRGTLLEGVWLDLDGGGSYEPSELVLVPSASNGSFASSGGVEHTAGAAAPISVAIVDPGPGRATVRVEGFHRSGGSALLRYVTFLTFRAGSADVALQHTMIEGRVMGSGNGGWPGGVVETPLDRAGLRLRLALAGGATATLSSDSASPLAFALPPGQAAYVRQRPHLDWQQPLVYEVWNAGSMVGSGARAREAWADLSDSRWGLAASTRDFWRKSPQRLAVSGDGTLTVELPSEPYTILQGQGFMEEVLLSFHAGAADAAAIRGRMQGQLKDPLFLTAPASWYVASGALGELTDYPSAAYPEYEQALDAQMQATLAWIDEGHAFGLMNYLDMPIDRYDQTADPHRKSWGNSYYDPAGAQIKEFARRGDPRWLRDLAFPMVRHHYSVDCYDTDDSSWYMNGISGARGEMHRGAWTGEYHYLESLWPYYYLTGDRRALERGLAAARTYAGSPVWENDYDLGSGYPGLSTRMMAQKMNTMLEGYLASGDPALLSALTADAEDFVVVWGTPEHFFRGSREQRNPYYTDQGFMTTVLYMDALWKYHALTGSPAARTKLVTTPVRILEENRISPDPGSPDYLEFYNLLEVTAQGGGGYVTIPYLPFGNSDDYLYEGGVHGLVASACRASALSGDPAPREAARLLYEQRTLPRWNPGVWDKPASQDTLRAATALAYLDPSTGAATGGEILAGEGHGPSNPNLVRILGAGGSVAAEITAYGAGAFGVNVAAGDVDGGSLDVVTGPGPGEVFGPQVRGFARDGSAVGKLNYFAYGTLKYGVNPNVAALDADAFGEPLSGAGPGAVFGPHVRGWNYDGTLLAPVAKVNFFAYGTLKYGVNASSGDVDGDAYGELVTGPGPGAIFGPQVRGFDYDGTLLSAIAKINFDAFATAQQGARVATGRVDPDAFAEILAAPGPGAGPSFPARFRGFDHDGLGISALPGFDIVGFAGTSYGGRVGAGEIDGAGAQELTGAPGPDPSAPSSIGAWSYDGAGLSPAISPFEAFPGTTHGADVTAGDYAY